jgi:uncharacterized protein (DUF1330 family)
LTTVFRREPDPTGLVLFLFPDRQSIHDLFNDPGYQTLKAIRHEEASSVGVEMLFVHAALTRKEKAQNSFVPGLSV